MKRSISFWGLVWVVLLVGCVSQVPAMTPVSPTVESGEGGDEGRLDTPEDCRLDTAGCAVIEPGETILISMVGPMTGDYAAYGTDIYQGGLLAVEDFGSYLDWDFELLPEDSLGDPALAVSIAGDLAQNPRVVAIAGHIFSGETAAAIPIYETASIPMISPSATNPDLTQLGSDVFNRISLSDVAQARYAARYLYQDSGVRRVALVSDGSGYGDDLIAVMGREFTSLGGEVLLDLRLETVIEEDVSQTVFDPQPLLDLIEQNEPDVQAVYFGGYDGPCAIVARAIHQQPELIDMLIIGPDGIYGSTFIDRAGEWAEGVLATSPVPPPLEPRVAFDLTYEAEFDVAPGVLSSYTWYGYDAVGVLIYAVKQVAIVGRDGKLYVPRTVLVRMVRQTANYPGLTGIITCSSIGECGNGDPTLYRVVDGTWMFAQ